MAPLQGRPSGLGRETLLLRRKGANRSTVRGLKQRIERLSSNCVRRMWRGGPHLERLHDLLPNSGNDKWPPPDENDREQSENEFQGR